MGRYSFVWGEGGGLGRRLWSMSWCGMLYLRGLILFEILDCVKGRKGGGRGSYFFIILGVDNFYYKVVIIF